MPYNRHNNRQHNGRDDMQNNNGGVILNGENNRGRPAAGQAGARIQQCCVPTGCSDDPIDSTDPEDAVRVSCNNEACGEGVWMHKDCFIEWEQSVLSFLRSCGRARSWSEKQRLQNLWTKKGYDLAYKACDCKCGKGHIRKDLDYIPPPKSESKKVKKNKKKNDKPMPVVSTNHKGGHNNNNHNSSHNHHVENHAHQPHIDLGAKSKKPSLLTPSVVIAKRRGSESSSSQSGSSYSSPSEIPSSSGKNRIRNCLSESTSESEYLDGIPINSHGQMSSHPQVINPLFPRLRTNSVGSTGSAGSQISCNSSIPGSAGSLSPLSSSPTVGNVFFRNKKLDTEQNHQGVFQHREDYSAFNVLPAFKRNHYHVHTEDVEEDEETRNLVLSNLTNKRMTALKCVLCKKQLPVFDRFPLIDGTLFLSPQAYDQYVVQMIYEGKIQFLNAVCIGCLHGASEAKCVGCKQQWDGSSLVVGTMYTYDIFAAMPCCQKRLTCKYCRRAVIDISIGLNFFSHYSRMTICPYCKANDYHFIRSLADTFSVRLSICGQ